MRLAAVFVLVFFVFGQFCVAVPFVADTVRRSFASVRVPHPGRLQNVPVAQLGVPYVFQLDLNTFTVIDSDSGAPLKVLPVVALDPDSNIPHWISFDPDKLVFSGTPDAVLESPFRIRLIATALESGDQNDTAFDLYVSGAAPPSLISSFEHQHDMDLMTLVNASQLVTEPGVWIHPGSLFTVQVNPFCNVSGANSSLYYSVYHPSNSSFDPLPEWLHFDNTTLVLTGTSPMEPTSTHVMFRCSNIYGAGGPGQTLLIDIAEHEIELDGAPFAFELTPGQPFKYNFQWLSDQLWTDGNSARGRKLLYSNGSHFSPVNTSSGDIGLSFSLNNYPWLYFDNVNTTIYGTPPPTKELSLGLPSVPLNISYRGQQLETEIPVYSLGASPWASSRDAGVVIFPDREFSHNFSLDLIDSVRSDPRWGVFIQIDDPLNQSSWLSFETTTHVLNGTVPAGSPSRNIDIRVTSNAWGFNSTIPYYININNPDWVPPTLEQHAAWSSTSVTVTIALVIVIILLIMFIFMLCGLWHGWLLSPIFLYRRRHRSSQTLVDSSLEIGAGSKSVRPGDIQVHVEHKVEATTSTLEAPNMGRAVPEHDISGPVLLVVPSALSSPTSATTPSTLTACSASASSAPSSSGPSSPRTKFSPSQALGAATCKQSSPKGKFRLFRKRVTFGKDSTKKHVQKPAIVVSAVPRPHIEPKEAPFTPLWKGHVYQTPELLRAEEDVWKARRLERKARLKREYFAKKEAEAQGRFVDTRFPAPKEDEDDAPKPGAPRRFGIFEQLAKMEDLDRRGPANMRGDVPRSRLVEVGENRLFNDTMVDRSEVGSSEFSSLASWETLSESSLPDMVLCYGQLGRRKVRAGDAPKTPRAPIDPWGTEVSAGPVYREEGSLPGPDDETTTDENLLDRLARSLGSELNLDENGDEINSVNSHIESESRGPAGGVAAASPVKWKGKAVAWGEHESPTTQHSPTFKRLARQRFRASIDSTIGGSPLSKIAIARTLAYTSPSSQSIATGASSDLSPSGSMASLVFHVNEQGVYYYVIPASTRFCFTARISKIDGEEADDDKPTFGRAKAAAYGVQTDDPNEPSMPLWLHFNAPGLEFWGYAPNTDERLQHAMKIVHRESGEVVGRLLIVVARLDDVASAQAALGYPIAMSDTPCVIASMPSFSKLAAAINLACRPQISGVPPQSSRSIATSHTGTNLSSSGSMTTVVFHLARDGIDFFVIPANTQFCFEVPGLQTNTTKSTFGRAVASPYMLQVDETSEVVSIPQWLHFVAQSMEFWGEAPDVAERLRIGMKIVQRETGKVAMRLLIVVARLDDVGSLQAELNYGRVMENDGLSVVEEVSSIDSDEDRTRSKAVEAGPAEPKTPERPRANISVSSSRGARSFRGTTRSQVGSKFNSPASRRSPGTGGRGGRMRTPMSARMGTYEDYDSVMFEGQSQYSGSLFGPELGTLAGGAISSTALEAMSRAASRAGSISLLPDQRTMVIAPTSMDGVEYYVIRGGVDFYFTLRVPKGRAYGVEFEVDKKQEEWKAPEWIGVDMDEEAGTLEFSGSTHGLEVYEEQTIVVLEGGSGDEVKRVRVVVVPDAKV